MPVHRPLLTKTAALVRRRAVIAAVAVAATGVVAPLVVSTGAQAADQTRDGRTESTALASCWDVKQVTPSAASGTYWLYTPALGYPQKFYCDMTTDGGGWVLVGRGREGWNFTAAGQGTTADVAANVTGTAAFAPRHLTNDAVNGLLDGKAVSGLDDGLRVRRATDAAGTSWQEVRLSFSTMGSWSWALGGGYPLSGYQIGGGSYTGGDSKHACPDAGLTCVDTTRNTGNKYSPGFAYGSAVTGSTASTSYLWSRTDGGGSAVPFAQAYLRPKLRWADLSFPAASAVKGSTVRPVFDNFAQPQPYGVSGLANGFSTERDTEVRSITQVGSTMFVGGNFAQVDKYADGTHTDQAYLAAFDAATGNWVSSFRPVLNGKVNAVVKLPSGLLAVGGEFTKVNGVSQAGLAVLDPATGELASGFKATLEYRASSGTTPGTVTALSVQGTWLYLGGTFTHVAGGSKPTTFVYAKRGVRLAAASGLPDGTWNPEFNAAPIFVLASTGGSRVYYGGFMSTMNAGKVALNGFAAVTATSPAAPVTGLKERVATAPGLTYQQAAAETSTAAGDRFWLGGSEHSFMDYAPADFSLVRPDVSRSDDGPGGDFQAAVVDNGVAYGSCHCSLSYVFGNSRTWNPPSDYDRVDTMRYVAAFDAATGVDVPNYLPWIATRAVRGPWSLVKDTVKDCLWVGGDLTTTKRTTDSAWQSSGGFARFCHTDATAPSVPAGVTAKKAASGAVTVAWSASSDTGVGGVRYTVFRDNHAVATVTGTSATLPAVTGVTTYSVRALDKNGNTSALSAAVSLP